MLLFLLNLLLLLNRLWNWRLNLLNWFILLGILGDFLRELIWCKNLIWFIFKVILRLLLLFFSCLSLLILFFRAFKFHKNCILRKKKLIVSILNGFGGATVKCLLISSYEYKRSLRIAIFLEAFSTKFKILYARRYYSS